MSRRFLTLFASVFVMFLMLAGSALADADVPHPQPLQALPSMQFWTLAVGALVPLVTYVLNHYAPWASEKVKATVLLIASAAAGAAYPLIVAGDWSLDTRHLELVGSAVVAALFAHKLLWVPSGISAALGGGSNNNGTASDPAVVESGRT